MMRRLVGWLVALGVLVVAAGCTGTVTTRTPLFVVVGFGGATNGQVALVEDLFFRDELAFEQRFRFIEESRRDVGARPIMQDVVDRENSRRQLVVLSRGDAQQDHAAFLDFFNLQDLDPEDPSAFATPADRPRLALDELATDEPDSLYCPINVQVSENGRFVALLNNFDACTGISGSPSIDIIDLDQNPPRVVQRVETPPVLTRTLPQSSPGAFFLDQRTNRVYYFEETTGARLRYIQLNENTGAVTLVDTGPTVPLPGNQSAVHLHRVGNTLVTLLAEPAQLAPIVINGSTYTAEERIATSPSPRRLIIDEQDRTTAVLVLAASQLTVHTSVEDTAPASTNLTAVAGTIESNDQFVYLVNQGQIILFDLFTHLGSPPATGLNIRTHAVPELVSPAFVTWAQAVVPEEQP